MTVQEPARRMRQPLKKRRTARTQENFGVLLEHAGQPLSSRLLHVSRQHWLKNLGAPRSRTLFWQNMLRIVRALGIVHAQGLVHGNITANSVMTEAAEEPDFQLTGFEWSLWLAASKADRAQARLGTKGEAVRAERYSFAEDWRALGRLIAHCLDLDVRSTGEVTPGGRSASPLALGASERILIKRLVAPTRLDNLDADSIGRSIKDLIADVGRTSVSRSGGLILMFAQGAKLGEAVFDASKGEIAVDEYRDQLDWVRADLDGGAMLLVPRVFDPQTSRLHLVTNLMDYSLGPLRQDGAIAWDCAVCSRADTQNLQQLKHSCGR